MVALSVEFGLAVHISDVRPMFLDVTFYEHLATLERAETVNLTCDSEIATWTRRMRLGFMVLTAVDAVTWSGEDLARLESTISGPAVQGRLHGALQVRPQPTPTSGSKATFVGDYELHLPAHLRAFTATAGAQLGQALSLRGEASQRWAAAH